MRPNSYILQASHKPKASVFDEGSFKVNPTGVIFESKLIKACELVQGVDLSPTLYSHGIFWHLFIYGWLIWKQCWNWLLLVLFNHITCHKPTVTSAFTGNHSLCFRKYNFSYSPLHGVTKSEIRCQISTLYIYIINTIYLHYNPFCIDFADWNFNCCPPSSYDLGTAQHTIIIMLLAQLKAVIKDVVNSESSIVLPSKALNCHSCFPSRSGILKYGNGSPPPLIFMLHF